MQLDELKQQANDAMYDHLDLYGWARPAKEYYERLMEIRHKHTEIGNRKTERD